MTPLATTEDFEARFGTAPATAEALLSDASSLILTELAASEAQWVADAIEAPAEPAEPEEVPDVVKAVCATVAYRASQNPGGLVTSERLGDHAVSFREGATDGLYLTARERRIVREAAGMDSVRSITLETPYSGDGFVDPELTL